MEYVIIFVVCAVFGAALVGIGFIIGRNWDGR